MKPLIIKKIAVTLLAGVMLVAPLTAQASVLKVGSRGNDVKVVQKSLKSMGYFTYSDITGYYGKITANAVKKFQKENGLYADGIIGKNTQRVLSQLNTEDKKKAVLSSTVSNNRVESNKTTNSSKLTYANLDWFKNVIGIWKRGVNATVTDVDTGLSFEVKRTYGTNHADVEPLTKEDSAIIKKIWGGFTWERRAVVVEVGNYVLPGSMTSMAHAGLDNKRAGITVNNRSAGYGRGTNLDAVKNNGANGVMDIHFKNSRTHSTNVKQQVHQNMIAKAYKHMNNTK